MSAVVKRLTSVAPAASIAFQVDPNSGNAIPKHKLPYHRLPCLPLELTAELSEQANRWMQSHGIDDELGPERWATFVKEDTPGMIGYTCAGLDWEPAELLWAMKKMGWVFAADVQLEETECAVDINQACKTMLDIVLVLMWYYPDDQRFLEFVKSVSAEISSSDAKAVLRQFEENIDCARNKTKSIQEVKLDPLGAAIRDVWTEYCENVPLGVAKRMAYFDLDHLLGSFEEVRIRKANLNRHHTISTGRFVCMRRLSVTMRSWVVVTDLIIARKIKRGAESISHIPDYLFWSGSMQAWLEAITDAAAWQNDIYSFRKEFVSGTCMFNLVHVVARDYGLAGYYEGSERVCEMMLQRLEEMEGYYEELRELAAPEYHSGIDLHMKMCRRFFVGSDEWHSRTARYNRPHVCVRGPIK